MKVNTESKGKCRTTETVIIKETKIVVSSTEERRQYRKRKQRDTHYIKVNGQLVPVSEEVFDAYHYYERRERSLAEKDFQNGVVSYDALDTEDMLGEDMFPDESATSPEDVAIANLLSKQLHAYLAKLPLEDQKLLRAIYFEGMSERNIAEQTGIPKSTISDRRLRAIAKLKKFFENP